MSLYTTDEIRELRACDPRALLSMLNAINGTLLIKDTEFKWNLEDVKRIVDTVNTDRANMDGETLVSKSPINLSDGLLDKIRSEVLNNPRIVEDDVVTPEEIGWTDILISGAGITEPDKSFKMRKDMANWQDEPQPTAASGNDVIDGKPTGGFPPAGEDRIEKDPNA